MTLSVKHLAPGLWRWTAAHPEWRPEKGGPGGWEREVACVYYEPPEAFREGVILIDPLVPADDEGDRRKFEAALDRDVTRRGKPIAVLLGNYFHQRSAAWVEERYRARPGVEIWVPELAGDRVTGPGTRTFRPGDPLPGGVRGFEIVGLEKSETVYFIEPHRALVFADAVLGAGGGKVRVAPPSWAENSLEGQSLYEQEFRASLRRLLDLPADSLLVSHGEPVLSGGREALAEALDSPPWGRA
jgi:glyoxylase-like metal-dependent hydrolase (beta-lactamase superfamily II)